MSVLPIAHIGNPVLRERATEVDADALSSAETQSFIDDLVETMRAANGAGIAAPQVSRSVRICVVEVQDNPRYPYKPNVPLTVMINPVIEPLTTDTFENYEGCLSVPNLRGVVDRFTRITLRYQTREGTSVERDIAGLTAGTFQHELDHLDGVLFIDRVKDPRTLATWADFERFHKAAFIERIVPFIAKMGG